MALGLVGRKCGMSRLFDETGASIPVTLIEVLPNCVTQIKTAEKEGYSAIQVTRGTHKVSRVTKPLRGHYAKSNVAPGDGLWEFKLNTQELAKINSELKMGSQLAVDLFQEGQWVDIWGITKGKGFAGVMKRHHCGGQNASHGTSLAHRSVGSIGQRQTPNWVAKGKTMPGHLGAKRRTQQNLKVAKIDKERNLLIIKGAVPGAPGGYVVISPASKKISLKGE